MDPITTAVIAAITAGVTGGITDTGKKVIVDAYEALKIMLKKKFGGESDLIKSIEGLETKPESTGRREMLKEEVIATRAEQDLDILQAAQDLLDKLSVQPGGEQHIQNAIGSNIAQADRGSTATVRITHAKE